MLSGKELGKALTQAMELKGVGPSAVAEAFGVKPPSVKDWQQFGRIHKRHLPKLVEWFSDVVRPEHWGFHGSWPQSTSALDSPQDQPPQKGVSATSNASQNANLVRFVSNDDLVGAQADLDTLNDDEREVRLAELNWWFKDLHRAANQQPDTHGTSSGLQPAKTRPPRHAKNIRNPRTG